MDLTERKITKIAREASKLAVRTLKEDGIGTAEYDFIHLVRHHPGITQAEVREQLRVDKGAAARRAASLEAKGYLIRQANPKDGRRWRPPFMNGCWRSCRRRRRSLSAKRWTPSIAVPSRRAGRGSPTSRP